MKVCGPKPGLYTLKLFAATTEQTQLLGICSLPLELTHMHIGPSLVRQTGTCTVETPVQRQLEVCDSWLSRSLMVAIMLKILHTHGLAKQEADSVSNKGAAF